MRAKLVFRGADAAGHNAELVHTWLICYTRAIQIER